MGVDVGNESIGVGVVEMERLESDANGDEVGEVVVRSMKESINLLIFVDGWWMDMMNMVVIWP